MDIFDEKAIAPYWYAVLAAIGLTVLSGVGLIAWLMLALPYPVNLYYAVMGLSVPVLAFCTIYLVRVWRNRC